MINKLFYSFINSCIFVVVVNLMFYFSYEFNLNLPKITTTIFSSALASYILLCIFVKRYTKLHSTDAIYIFFFSILFVIIYYLIRLHFYYKTFSNDYFNALVLHLVMYSTGYYVGYLGVHLDQKEKNKASSE